jgi:penicillin-binding protein 1A
MATAASSPLKRTLITHLQDRPLSFVVGVIRLGGGGRDRDELAAELQELVRRDDLGQMIRVRAADGPCSVSLGPSFGEWLSYGEIPPIHEECDGGRGGPAVPLPSGRRSGRNRARPQGQRDRGGRVRGVSTITQQLARNIFLTSKRSYGRKLREAVLALAIEAASARTRSSSSI